MGLKETLIKVLLEIGKTPFPTLRNHRLLIDYTPKHISIALNRGVGKGGVFKKSARRNRNNKIVVYWEYKKQFVDSLIEESIHNHNP